MKTAKTIKQVRTFVKNARKKGKKIGLVPTMGALHIGHISLIEAAVKKCDYVVVSIFVNPTQFGSGEDLQKYPRPLENDLRICRKAGADLVFVPSAKEIYPSQNITWVNVDKLTEPLCGRTRPTHFRGVTTVCSKLFNIVTPDIAFFGQKDAQQSIVIKKMVADLNMPLKIIVCPTVRETDGLAVSSRNQYLTKQQRKNAAGLYKALKKSRQMVNQGCTDTGKIKKRMRNILEKIPSAKIEYISVADIETLQELKQIKDRALVALAVKIGRARLIDNILLDLNKK